MIGTGLGGAHLRWWGRGEAYLMQEKLKASNRKKLINNNNNNNNNKKWSSSKAPQKNK